MRRSALVGQQYWSAGAEVGISAVQGGYIERREVIHHRQAAVRRKPQHTGAIILIADIEAAISSNDKDIARGVCGRPGAVPVSARRTIGSGVKERDSRKGGGVIPDDPAVIRLDIAKRSKSQIHHAIQQQQSRAVILALALPLTFALRGKTENSTGHADLKFMEALSRAWGYGSYRLLVVGFFVCGFHLAFISVHMPAYLVQCGLSPSVGGWCRHRGRPPPGRPSQAGSRARLTAAGADRPGWIATARHG